MASWFDSFVNSKWNLGNSNYLPVRLVGYAAPILTFFVIGSVGFSHGWEWLITRQDKSDFKTKYEMPIRTIIQDVNATNAANPDQLSCIKIESNNKQVQTRFDSLVKIAYADFGIFFHANYKPEFLEDRRETFYTPKVTMLLNSTYDLLQFATTNQKAAHDSLIAAKNRRLVDSLAQDPAFVRSFNHALETSRSRASAKKVQKQPLVVNKLFL